MWKIAPFVLLVFVVSMIPLAAATAIAGSDYVMPAITGTTIGLFGTLILPGARRGLVIVGLMAAGATAAVLVSPWPLAGAALLGMSGVLIGLTSLKGWGQLTTIAVIWCAYLVVTPPQIGSAAILEGGAVEFSLRAGWITALIVIATGAFMLVATPLLFRGQPPVPLTPETDRRQAYVAAACIGLLLFVESLVVLSEYRVPAAHWLLLTTLVLVQPTRSKALRRGIHRAIGTVAGAVIASMIVLSGVQHEARMIIGFALLIAALTIMVTPRPYWLYATLLTPAIILLSAGDANTLDVTAARLGFTLISIALAFGVMVLALLLERRGPASGPASV